MQYFLFRPISEYLNLDFIQNSVVFFIKKIDEIDRTVSAQIREKTQDYLIPYTQESIIPYFQERIIPSVKNFNFDTFFIWISNHIIVTLLSLILVILIFNKLQPKKEDKTSALINNLQENLNNLSLDIDLLGSLSMDQLDYRVEILEEIIDDLKFLKNYIYCTNNSPRKHKKNIKKMELITVGMINRIDKRSARKLLPKLNQLRRIIDSYS